MNAVWFNQLDFDATCRTSRLEMANAFHRTGHSLKVVGRYRHEKPFLGSTTPRPLLLKQCLPDPAGGIFFQIQLLFVAVWEVLRKTDLILVDHFCVPTMLPFALLSRIGIIGTKFILDVRSSPVDTLGIWHAVARYRYRLGIRLADLFYDGLTVITALYRDSISSRLGIDRRKIAVWTSGVRADIFDNRRVDITGVDCIKCVLGIGERLAILYHGVLSPFRGLQQVVRALALLSPQQRQRVIWIVLGDGPAAAELICLAEKEGVSDALKVMNSVSYEEVPNYLSAGDVGILPYPNIEWLNMNSPLKLLEYLAMEKPVLLTDIPAHRTVLGDAPCAFYIPDNSPTTIAHAIGNLVAQRENLPKVGKQGRDIVLSEFTWESQARKLLAYAASLGPGKEK